MMGAYTAEQLTEILERALTAIEEKRRGHVYDKRNGRQVIWHYDSDFERLKDCCDSDIIDEDDYWGIVQDCLVHALNAPLFYYKRPQQPICSHEEALDEEMYAFVVKLPDFKRKIYTKFSLIEKDDGTWYVSIRCHT
jgi:hypothetical protein